MGNRLVRDGVVDSESVCALSDWSYRAYINLLVRSDDAGRFDGRPEFLRSHLFPLGTRKRNEDFVKALDEMESPKNEAGCPLPALLIRYEFTGKPYIQLAKVTKYGKALNSKYPWKDGSFKIDFVARDTRDGLKDFVVTSLVSDGVRTPSPPHTDGMTTNHTDTDTDTGTKTGRPADAGPPPIKEPKAKRAEPTGESAEVEQHYRVEWSKRYGAEFDPPWSRGKDDAANKHFRKACKFDMATAKLAITKYLQNNEEFFSERKHPFALFVSQCHRFIVPTKRSISPAIAGAVREDS